MELLILGFFIGAFYMGVFFYLSEKDWKKHRDELELANKRLHLIIGKQYPPYG